MKRKDTRGYPYLGNPPAARCYWRGEQDRPQHREFRALLFATNVWVFYNVPQFLSALKSCETGPTV